MGLEEDWWCGGAETKIGCPQCRDPCRGKPIRRDLLEVFAIAAGMATARSVLMINMCTADLNDQLAFLEHAATIGVLQAGTHVELGDEFYWGKYAGR